MREVYNAWEPGSDWTIAYVCNFLGANWFANELAALEATCLSMGASKVISYDCNGDAAKEIQSVEDAIAQGVDFIIVVPSDETVSFAVVEKCVEAGIPCMSEDDPLMGTDGKTRLTPSFELDSYTVGFHVGESLAQWAVDNNVLTTSSDYSKVGLMDVDCTVVSSFVPRPIGIQDGFLSVFTNFPQENVFRPDTQTTLPDEGYAAASACLAANPDITMWFLSGCNDECTVGALRAFQDLGKDTNLYAFALGAYMANAEWDVYGAASPFVGGYYISSTMDAQITGTAVMTYLKEGTIPFEEYRNGKPFGLYPFLGVPCDYSNYVQVITDIEGSYTPATQPAY
jgi:ABC-type sugar transport system substrate-binding protein